MRGEHVTCYILTCSSRSILILLMCIYKTFKSKLFTTLAVLFKAPLKLNTIPDTGVYSEPCQTPMMELLYEKEAFSR